MGSPEPITATGPPELGRRSSRATCAPLAFCSGIARTAGVPLVRRSRAARSQPFARRSLAAARAPLARAPLARHLRTSRAAARWTCGRCVDRVALGTTGAFSWRRAPRHDAAAPPLPAPRRRLRHGCARRGRRGPLRGGGRAYAENGARGGAAAGGLTSEHVRAAAAGRARRWAAERCREPWNYS